jgi:hypothetical protein
MTDKKGDGDCWDWIGCCNQKGYGLIKIKGKSKLAHRISWEIYKGLLLKNICVLHKCDNPKCVNPEHLFLGTRADNMKDMADKGRSKQPYDWTGRRHSEQSKRKISESKSKHKFLKSL